MEKIKVYFCGGSECIEDFLPCSFTFKDVVEHFGYSCKGKEIAVGGFIVKESQTIDDKFDCISFDKGVPIIDVVLLSKYYE